MNSVPFKIQLEGLGSVRKASLRAPPPLIALIWGPKPLALPAISILSRNDGYFSQSIDDKSINSPV